MDSNLDIDDVMNALFSQSVSQYINIYLNTNCIFSNIGADNGIG